MYSSADDSITAPVDWVVAVDIGGSPVVPVVVVPVVVVPVVVVPPVDVSAVVVPVVDVPPVEPPLVLPVVGQGGPPVPLVPHKPLIPPEIRTRPSFRVAAA